MTFLRLALATCLLATATAAHADDFFVIPGTSPMDHIRMQRAVTSSAIDNAVLSNVIRKKYGPASDPRNVQHYASDKRKAAPRPPASNLYGGSVARAPTAARPTRLPFTAGRADQDAARDAFLARLETKDPAMAKTAATQFRAHDMDQVYAGITRPFGLSPDDAGDVMTAYLVLGWLIANGAPDPTATAVRAARGQVGSLLATQGPIADPAQRVAVAEEVKILFVVLHSGWLSARRENAVQPYADGVATLFQDGMQQPLRQIALTDTGFVRR